jgi:hypothetical protein
MQDGTARACAGRLGQAQARINERTTLAPIVGISGVSPSASRHGRRQVERLVAYVVRGVGTWGPGVVRRLAAAGRATGRHAWAMPACSRSRGGRPRLAGRRDRPEGRPNAPVAAWRRRKSALREWDPGPSTSGPCRGSQGVGSSVSHRHRRPRIPTGGRGPPLRVGRRGPCRSLRPGPSPASRKPSRAARRPRTRAGPAWSDEDVASRLVRTRGSGQDMSVERRK